MTNAAPDEPRARLTDASIALFESLDWDELPARIAALAVPALADFCMVDVIEDSRLRPAAALHVDPNPRAVLEALHVTNAVAVDAPLLQAQVLAACEARLVASVTDETVAALTRGAQQHRLLMQLEPRSLIVAPLCTHGRAEGVLTLVRCAADRRFGAAELALAEELARRAALALHNARVHRDLEQVLLPRIARSEERLAEAQRVAHVGSFEWEIAANSVSFTDELQRIYGVAPGQFAGTFEALLACIHPEDRERTRSVLFDAFRSKTAFSYDHRVVRPDGSVRTLHTRGGIVQDAHGKPLRVVATSWDITELRAAIAACQRSCSLLQATLEATAHAVLVVDRTGDVVFTNERLSSLWRLAKDRIDTRNAQAFFELMLQQVEDPDGFRAGVLALEGRAEDPSDDLVRLKDGRVFERRSRPQRMGAAVVGRVWSFYDVSERERLLQHTVFLADATRLLASLDVQQAVAAVAQLIVPQLAWGCAIELVSDDGTPHAISVSRDAQHPFAGAPHPEARAGRATRYQVDGSSYLGVPIVTKRGVDGVLTLSAAPQRTYAQEELDLVVELADRIALAVENARLYRHAQDAVRARDEFLAIASHEIRGPISTLHLAVHMLRSDDDAPDSRRQHLELIERQNRRLAQFVDELLDLSRIRAGTMRFTLEDDVDFAELVRGVAQRLGPELARAGSQLSLEIDSPVRGRWDRMRLDQVVTNLLANAIKFGPRKPIRVALSARAGWAELVVADQGIGIAPELHERIFRPFERGVSVRNYGGLGLGLYIVRTIVEALGGSVSVASAKGAGAAFTVRLPQAQARSRPS